MAMILGPEFAVMLEKDIRDIGGINNEHQVGVLVKGDGEESLYQAYNVLVELSRDPYLPRCSRTAAEETLSLATESDVYRGFYLPILRYGSKLAT